MGRPISAVIPTNTPQGKKAYMKLYWENNKDKKKMYEKKYREKNKEKAKHYAKQYYIDNKEKMRSYMRDYTIKNRAKLSPMWQRNYLKRRAKLAGVESERYEKLDVYKRDNGVCYICSEHIDILMDWPHPKSFSIDHIIPLSRGGDNTLNNVASTHLRCNISKSTKITERAI